MGLSVLLVCVGLGCLALSVSAVPGDCTFDDDLCGYTQDTNDRFDWIRHSGPTPKNNTGPDADHTTGNGWYLYIEPTWQQLNGEEARIVSPAISDSTGNCLAFYYHMNGLNIRQLNVYTQETSGSRTLRWSITGDQETTDWLFGNVALPSSRKNLKIVFEGIAGTGSYSHIAIDDIKVYDSLNCNTNPFVAQPQAPKPTSAPSPPSISSCGIKPQGARIVGGHEAPRGAWPWQAMFQYYSSTSKVWRQFCGATMITPEWVVTASHCVSDIRKQDYTTHRIRMGAHYKNKTIGSEQDLNIKRIYMHPDYNLYPYGLDNDIALIRLERPAMLNKVVNLACLPDDSVQFATGTMCSISGWGTLESGGNAPNVLHEAKVPLVSFAECTKNNSYYAEEMSPRMQCAGYPGKGGVDTCQGDSGGPLVCENNGKWYLVGVTSWGYSCADGRWPGVYAKVHKLKKWIYQVIANPGAY